MRRWMVRTAVVVLAGLSPAWAKADDQEMAQEIAAALRDSGQLRSYSIGVKYKDGVALLAGRVQDARQRRLAQQLASECDGVEQVINNLSVQAGEPEAPRLRQPRSVAGVRQAAMEEDYGALDMSGIESTPAPARTPVRSSPRIARAANVRRTAAAQETYTDAGTAAGAPLPINGGAMAGPAPMSYDQPNMPEYAWPSYASYPNYAAVTYPKQYSPTVWPYIGPFYPYPQVPLGWRKVTMEWKDGWWWLDFHNGYRHH